MKSKTRLKQLAISSRQKGVSYHKINTQLKIPKSTLNHWLSGIRLSSTQRHKLLRNWQNALIKARKKAAVVNKSAKKQRLKNINLEVDNFFRKLSLNQQMLEIFLSALFLGEGFKNEGKTAMGCSDPIILKCFITLLRLLYKTDEKKFRGVIYARADQNINSLIKYWSSLLKIPPNRFQKTQIDKRTLNKKTYPGYKGVCAVYYYDTAIQRRILSIGNKMLKYINSKES